MTIRHFKIFLAVYKDLNMTSAANKLLMTQPSISQAIKEMEDQYGKKLFERMSNRLYITEAGEEVFQYASHIIKLTEELDEKMRQQGAFNTLIIGANYTIGSVLIHDYLKLYKRACPDSQIKVIVNKASALIKMLRNNQLDLVMMEERPEEKDLLQKCFYNDRIVFVVSPKNSLATEKEVTFKQIATQSFLLREPGAGVRDLFDAKMNEQGYYIIPQWESTSTTSIIRATENNYGIGVLPYELVRHDLENGTLKEILISDLDFHRKLVVAVHRNKYISPEIQKFMEIVLAT